MAGYREISNVDPIGTPSRPARPFNGVQWTGVALIVVGVALDLAFFAGEAGWLPKWRAVPSVAFTPLIFGTLLINSRRGPTTDPAPKLAAQRRKWLTITVSVVAVILGAATIIDIWRVS
jgi:hypothetical protein